MSDGQSDACRDQIETSGGYPPPGMGSTMNLPYEFKCSRCHATVWSAQPFKGNCDVCGGTLLFNSNPPPAYITAAQAREIAEEVFLDRPVTWLEKYQVREIADEVASDVMSHVIDDFDDRIRIVAKEKAANLFVEKYETPEEELQHPAAEWTDTERLLLQFCVEQQIEQALLDDCPTDELKRLLRKLEL